MKTIALIAESLDFSRLPGKAMIEHMVNRNRHLRRLI